MKLFPINLTQFGMVDVVAAAAKSLQSCPTLCDPIDGSPPGSSVRGIFQARTLEWVAISFSTRKHRGTLNSALGCLAEGSGTSSQNDAVQLRGFPLT